MKVQRTKKGNLIAADKNSFNSALIGMLLGDASFDRFCLKKGPRNHSKKGPFWNRTVLRFHHCEKDLEYLNWKLEFLKPYIDNFSVYDSNKNVNGFLYKGKEAFVRHRKNFHYLYKKFYSGGKIKENGQLVGASKIIKNNILNRINEIALSFWYMDDGSLYTYKRGLKTYRSLSLHTDGFKYEECLNLSTLFKDKYNICFNVNHNSTSKSREIGFKLRCYKEKDVELFLSLVYPLVSSVNCMKRKLP